MQRGGGIEHRPEPIELRALVGETLEVLGQTAAQKRIELGNAIATDLWVEADRCMLETVIRNLAGNALKFTPCGGRVTLAAREDGVNGQSGFVAVSVMDTGVGMSEDVVAKLFRLDAQHSTLGTEKEQGSGLGLLICREMVKQNAGKIWVESELGKGTAVEFTVPQATQPPA
jgi:two-component system sensor histidine kinase/response regulator